MNGQEVGASIVEGHHGEPGGSLAVVDPDKLMALRLPRRRRGRRHAQRRARRDGRPARLLPGAGRAGPDPRRRELADGTGTAEHVRPGVAERPGRRRLPSSYDPATGTFTLPPEQAMALTDESSPAFLPGFFQIALRHGPGRRRGSSRPPATRRRARLARAQLRRARRLRAVLPARLPRATWSASGCRPWTAWSTSSQRGAPGRRHRLRPRRVDDPDGPGVPELDVRRLRLPRRLDRDRPRSGPQAAGVADRVTFEVAPADRLQRDRLRPGDDLRRPARHGRPGRRGPARPAALADDGTWMVVEPAAGDHVEDNLNPVGRAYYGFSTLLCTPASLSQDVGLALGTQAGPARIRDVATAGRLHPVPVGGADAVQPCARGPALTRSPRRRSRRRPSSERPPVWTATRRGAPDRDATGVVDRDGVALAGRSTGQRRADDRC